MVIDSSAIVAILFQEADAQRYAVAIEQATTRRLSAVTRVELTCVVEGNRSIAGRVDLDRFLDLTKPEIVPVDLNQMNLAIEAYRAFGKGRHKAALNIGDCFAYALAKLNNETLLFKGNDFALTDIVAA